MTIPQSVKEAIGRRLNKLSQECIDVLHLAAVLGKQFEFADLEFATQQSEEYALSALDEAMNAQLIRILSGETFAFTHDKIREVLYGEINPIRRRRLHQRIGQTLEQRNSADLTKVVQELAFHFVEAADPEKGMQYSILAAKRAFDLSSLEESITYYEQARQCALSMDLDQQLQEIDIQLGRIFTLRGEFDEAKTAYRRALDLTPDPQQKTAIQVKIIGVDIHSGDLADGDTVLASIEELDPESQTLELTEALTALGRHYHYKAEFDKAIHYMERAYQLAQQIDDPFTMTHLLGGMAGAYQHQSKFTECLEWANKSLSYGETRPYLPAVAIGNEFLSETSNLLGNWSAGYDYALQDEAIGQKLGSQIRVAWANMSKAWAYAGLGRFEDAISFSQRAIELGYATDQIRMISLVHYILTGVYLNIGRFNKAKQEANELYSLASNIKQDWVDLLVLHVKALILAVQGDREGALHLLKDVNDDKLKKLTTTGQIYTGPLQGELLFLDGRLEQATVFLEKIVAITKTAGASWQESICYRLLGQILAAQGQNEAALSRFNQAIKIQRGKESLPELARSLHYRGQLFQTIDQPDTAELDLKEAQTFIKEMRLTLSPLTELKP